VTQVFSGGRVAVAVAVVAGRNMLPAVVLALLVEVDIGGDEEASEGECETRSYW
jgi:hypothetical protein